MFGSGEEIYVIIGFVLFFLAMAVRPLRKTMGLLIVILGAIACLSGIGIIIGIPMIIIGGLFLFI